MTEPLPTKYLPVELASPGELARQMKVFSSDCSLAQILDGMQNFSMVLNRNRQAVYVNSAFKTFLEEHGVKNIGGERFGVLAGCRHNEGDSSKCGTTEACRFCGAAQALEAALKGEAAVKECRIISRKSGDELDLRVQTKPFTYQGEEFLLMSMADISSDKRRQVLEKLFFHDILNTAGGVQGLVSLMESSNPEEAKAYVPPAVQAADRMVDQIMSQKDLAAAERGELSLSLSEFSAGEFMEEVAALFRAHDVASGREIVVLPCQSEVSLTTDRTLLSRVIGNLLKNALEAENDGAVVTLGCGALNGGAVFTVHNPRMMPEETRQQIFQRSFSTKGAGRGLGTYSIRLLTERYLGGKVSFTSSKEGTEFRIELPLKK